MALGYLVQSIRPSWPCYCFSVLWALSLAAVIAIGLGIGLPFILLARFVIDSRSWKYRILLRLTACILALLLFPAAAERGEATVVALGFYLLTTLIPGHAIARAEPTLLTILVLSCPFIGLAASIPGPTQILDWLRFPEVKDMVFGSSQLAGVYYSSGCSLQDSPD
jgi:hypothetical protein